MLGANLTLTTPEAFLEKWKWCPPLPIIILPGVIVSRFLDSIFYNFPEDSLNNCYKENINLDDLMSMLEENLPEVYTQSKELYKAFENLSKADLFKGRIHKRNHWRFLVYVNFYLTYGVSNSKIQHHCPM